MMIQSKFSLEASHVAFLEQHHAYGFKDKSEVVRFALQSLQQTLEQNHLKESAELYAQLYEEDPEIKDLTETALAEWPE
uniref:CopG family transcriptional regulator n=1 Tax=Cyanothece sp. (strain PCC 7425 / ATCC 29141) TaxID=395961 RepID=B8HY83_CYAP4